MNNIDFVNGSFAIIPCILTHFSKGQLSEQVFYFILMPSLPFGGWIFYKNVVKFIDSLSSLYYPALSRLLLFLCCPTSERDKLFQIAQEL